MSKENNNEVKTKRIVVTLELDVVTFPSGSEWVTDIVHTKRIDTALEDARIEFRNKHISLFAEEPDKENLHCIESIARDNLRNDKLFECQFKRVEDSQLFTALRDMLGVTCLINAAVKLNPFKLNH